MTRDEIEKLSPEELRLEIYRVKGLDPDLAKACLLSSVLDYPNYISEAWKLVEEMPHVRVIKWSDEWTCGVFCNDTYPEALADFHARGGTAPLAICQAWLMWKQGVRAWKQ